MTIAQVTDSTPVEVSGAITLPDRAQVSLRSVLVWTEEERNAAGLYTIVEPANPDGLPILSRSLEFDGKSVTRKVEFGEAPRRLVPKSDIQDRLDAIGFLLPVFEVLQANPREYLKWVVPNHRNVYADDPAMLQVFAAVGMSQEQIETVTAPATSPIIP